MAASDPSPQHPLHALYQDHQGWLQGWLRKKLGCALDAADLVHDTYLRVLSQREPGEIREPRPYLATIAHGLMVNHLRRKDLERAYLETLAQLPEPLAPSPEARALALEALVEIDTMLDGLPVAARRAFLLCQLEGMTHAEIASTLRVSVGSVRLYIARALRQCLELAP
ncbi:sigma-70 family RNA polymerase sigma factor [Achromobacter deleyi]|uniref:Sigma-70 family RNA polymerase sigma factor n=1 Tax=Achromobacter deleyi TaxID=1353891 RepID=A0A7T4B3R4_9BURK|nr:sigma-70 family RNA polymerase sigma factor [Achromobacter deleyi]QQB35171.1 sigma-70 family RNA polymerase sigma factor [Achromobacter deleyi]